MSLQYENGSFKTLIEKYATWEELRSYLESEEGGLFRTVDKSENGGRFSLIRYEKGVSNMSLPHSGWFRSVVWDTEMNMPVCVAPPKAAGAAFPYSTLKEISDAGVICQELLDGFMINCFRVVNDKTLYITSRSKLDASGKFYSEKTFRNLFIEAYMGTKYPTASTQYDENAIQTDSAELCSPDASRNEIAVFYSFLVQHKEHRIVTPIKDNSVYCIHRGTVYGDGRIVVEDSPRMSVERQCVENIPLEKQTVAVATAVRGGVSYAAAAAAATKEDGQTEVQTWIKGILHKRDWQFQGIVFKDSNGNRWRFRSEKYAAVKSLRGNSPTTRERFSQLFAQNLVHKYLEYYVEDTFPMTMHLMFINGLAKLVYDMYVAIHIMRVKTANDVDKMFRPHLYSIHGMYLARTLRERITLTDVQDYFHKLPWQRIAFIFKKFTTATDPVSTMMPFIDYAISSSLTSTPLSAAPLATSPALPTPS